MRLRLFEGTEVEGEFRGFRTLFVEGKVGYDVIRAKLLTAIEEGAPYRQVYFGAKYQGRNASFCSTSTAEAIAEREFDYPGLERITIDTRDQTTFSDAVRIASRHRIVHVMVTIQHQASQTWIQSIWHVAAWPTCNRIQIKLRGHKGGVLVANLSGFVRNNMSEMKEDKVVWP